MDETKLRAWWSHRQGLDGQYANQTIANILESTGWARSVAGAGPYLGLFARAGFSRQAVDDALATKQIHELPSARGCTYVLPATDFALGLRVGQPFRNGEMKVALKLGVTEKELDKLCTAVLKALKKGALDPDEIRATVGPAIRNLGEAGKKKGLTTTLPVALGKLQSEGEIRRVPINGRLDQQRYKYERWEPNPLAGYKITDEEAHRALAHRFFFWAGPATLEDFQAFSGLGVKASQAAVAAINVSPIKPGDPRLMLPHLRENFEKFVVPKTPQYVLTSSLDGLWLLRRDLKSLLDPSDLKSKVPGEKGPIQLGALKELPSHAILDRGRLVGLWEYDPHRGSIEWMSFGEKDAAMKKAVAKMEGYVRDQLGDARSFSLDSPASREPRLKALRKAG
jgi:hypothetical protein